MCSTLLIFLSRNIHFKYKHCTYKSIGWGNNWHLYCSATNICSKQLPLWGQFSYWPVTSKITLDFTTHFCPTWRGLYVSLPSFCYQLAFLMKFTLYLPKNQSASFKNCDCKTTFVRIFFFLNTVLRMNNHHVRISNSHNRLGQKMAVLEKLTYDSIYSMNTFHSIKMRHTP